MLKILVRLAWFFNVHKWRYLFAILILIIASILELVPAFLIGSAIDLFQRGSLGIDEAIQLSTVLITVIVLGYALNYIWMRSLLGGAYLLERTLRSRFMRHLYLMDPPFFEKRSTGDLLARGTNDMKAISMTAGIGILTLVDAVIFMGLILGAMVIVIDWRLTLAAALPLPIIAITVTILGKMIHTRFSSAQAAFGKLNDRVLQSVAGMRVIRAFRKEKADEQQFEAQSKGVFDRFVRVARVESFFDPIVNIVVGLSYVIGLGYGAYLVFQQQLTLGQLITFNLYLGMLIWPMFAIGELVNIMQQGSASYERVHDTMRTKKSVPEPHAPGPLKSHAPIVFQDVCFSYPSTSQNQLDRISFTVNRGETVGVVGRTGSGKSTLVKQLLKYYPSGSGEMTIGGIPIRDLSQQDMRSLIGYVPQDHLLFSLTVRENLLFSTPNATDAQINDAIQSAAFTEDVRFLPDGLETRVGENGVSLSGGQKQRISIARALLTDPEILILDDSLSAVDAKTEAQIVRNIGKERKHKTTFITAHRLSAVEQADLILVLDEGKITEHGTHEQLIQQNGWYKAQATKQSLRN
ncbi:ABC transporter ATP-binding protein [Geomicrobium sp. JSM 1781026]|uniref:ABC transporter ATP-binding protein n=1 Tax=Geomicrobium sp. JSM 1781026 TaxID=3344580 RepID=UPI0035BED935